MDTKHSFLVQYMQYTVTTCELLLFYDSQEEEPIWGYYRLQLYEIQLVYKPQHGWQNNLSILLQNHRVQPFVA